MLKLFLGALVIIGAIILWQNHTGKKIPVFSSVIHRVSVTTRELFSGFHETPQGPHKKP